MNYQKYLKFFTKNINWFFGLAMLLFFGIFALNYKLTKTGTIEGVTVNPLQASMTLLSQHPELRQQCNITYSDIFPYHIRYQNDGQGWTVAFTDDKNYFLQVVNTDYFKPNLDISGGCNLHK